MAVISFASLKGGVGKTSLSVNIAHAFAKMGNRVLLIDSDPSAHASRFFKDPAIDKAIADSTLARLFLSMRTRVKGEQNLDILEAAEDLGVPLLYDVRDNFSILPGSDQLSHFFWGPGATIFKKLFPILIEDLHSMFDLIVFDTCPDFNIITKNIISCSDAVVVPIDSSEMSIASLEAIFNASKELKGPKWSIVRTMIFKQAARVHRLTADRIAISDTLDMKGLDDENPNSFVEHVREIERNLRPEDSKDTLPRPFEELAEEDLDERDIFLVNASVHRTEQQNRLSFVAKTAFDSRDTKKLAAEYLAVAQELEVLLSMDDAPMDMDTDAFMPEASLS